MNRSEVLVIKRFSVVRFYVQRFFKHFNDGHEFHNRVRGNDLVCINQLNI